MRESGLKSCSCTKNNYHHLVNLLICYFIVLLTIIAKGICEFPSPQGPQVHEFTERYSLEQNETEYLNFPSEASEGRLLCLKGHNTKEFLCFSLARKYSRFGHSLGRPNVRTVEGFNQGNEGREGGPYCFEKAIVMSGEWEMRTSRRFSIY